MLMHATQRDKGHYYYEDDFMYFTFNGVYSRDYNLFITNEKKGYAWYTATGASHKTEKPLFQNYTYHIGTERSQKAMDFNVAAEGLTNDEIKEMFLWLEEGATGFLVVDWNIDWGYDVCITKVNNPEWYGRGRNSVITFKFSVATIGEFRARTAWNHTYTGSEKRMSNAYGIPDVRHEGNLFYIPMIGNQYQYVDYAYEFDRNNPSELTIAVKQNDGTFTPYLHYATKAQESVDGLSNINWLSYYGRSNYVLFNDVTLAENELDLIDTNAATGTSYQGYELLKLTGVGPHKIVPLAITSSIITPSQQTATFNFTLSQADAEAIGLLQDKGVYLSVSCPVVTEYADGNYPVHYAQGWAEPLELDNTMWTVTLDDWTDSCSISNLLFVYGQEHCLQIVSTPIDITEYGINRPAKWQLTVHKYNNL